MDLGPHAVFIVAAYVVTATIITGLIVHAVLGYRAQRRALAALEGRGVRRRSEDTTASAQPSLGSGVTGKG